MVSCQLPLASPCHFPTGSASGINPLEVNQSDCIFFSSFLIEIAREAATHRTLTASRARDLAMHCMGTGPIPGSALSFSFVHPGYSTSWSGRVMSSSTFTPSSPRLSWANVESNVFTLGVFTS